MSNPEVKRLLERLHEEIRNTDLDDETRTLVAQLDADIHELLDRPTDDADAGSVRQTAQSLEASFASEHPNAERFLREVIDTLGKMGI